MPADGHPFLRTLQDATNSHDLDALVDCFDPAYRNETPGHPGRSFQGHGQVRANWQQIFTSVPDIEVTVLRWVADGGGLWSEWEMSGTRLDGTPHLLRGVIIFALQADRAISARFYLEPVDDVSAGGVGDAVRRQVHAPAPGLMVPR